MKRANADKTTERERPLTMWARARRTPYFFLMIFISWLSYFSGSKNSQQAASENQNINLGIVNMSNEGISNISLAEWITLLQFCIQILLVMRLRIVLKWELWKGRTDCKTYWNNKHNNHHLHHQSCLKSNQLHLQLYNLQTMPHYGPGDGHGCREREVCGRAEIMS